MKKKFDGKIFKVEVRNKQVDTLFFKEIRIPKNESSKDTRKRLLKEIGEENTHLIDRLINRLEVIK